MSHFNFTLNCVKCESSWEVYTDELSLATDNSIRCPQCHARNFHVDKRTEKVTEEVNYDLPEMQ